MVDKPDSSTSVPSPSSPYSPYSPGSVAPGHRTPADPDDEAQLTPEASARLIAEQRRELGRSFGASGAPMYFAWGGIWLVAYFVVGLSYTSAWPAGLPTWLGGSTMAVLLVAGVVFTAWYLVRHQRGVRGRSQRIGAWYGASWFFGFTCMGVLGGAMERAGMSGDASALYFTVAPAALVGLGYISGGLLFDSRDESVIGAIVVVVAIAAALSGPGAACLVMSLAGGGTLIAGGVIVSLAARRRGAP